MQNEKAAVVSNNKREMHTCYSSLFILGAYFLNEGVSASSPSKCRPGLSLMHVLSAQGMCGPRRRFPCFCLLCPTFCGRNEDG